MQASEKRYIRDAIEAGESVFGFQFYLETTPESVLEIVSHCGDELIPAKNVQTEE